VKRVQDAATSPNDAIISSEDEDDEEALAAYMEGISMLGSILDGVPSDLPASDIISLSDSIASAIDSVPGEDVVSVRLGRDGIRLTVDGPSAVSPEDLLDLRIEIPRDRLLSETVKRRSNSLSRRMRSLARRLRGKKECADPDEGVLFIRDTLAVTGDDGRIYDLEVDLRVEMEDEEEKPRKSARSRSEGRCAKSCPSRSPWKKLKKSRASRTASRADTAVSRAPSGWGSTGSPSPSTTSSNASTLARSTGDLFRFTTV